MFIVVVPPAPLPNAACGMKKGPRLSALTTLQVTETAKYSGEWYFVQFERRQKSML